MIKVSIRKILTDGLLVFVFTTLIWMAFAWMAHAQGKPPSVEKQAIEVSYMALFAVASVAFCMVRMMEQMLIKTKLLRSDQDRQIEEIYQWIFSERGAKHQLSEQWEWHKPLPTAEGMIFPWKENPQERSDEKHRRKHIEDMVKEILESHQQLHHVLRPFRTGGAHHEE